MSTPAPKGPTSQPKAATPSSKPATPPGQAKQAATSTPKTGSGPKAVSTTTATVVVAPGVAAKLKPMFPDGTDLNLAAAGFKNLGQFVAAAHVSENLGIPFPALKTEMVDNGASLGRAIQTLKTGADVTVEVTRAEVQADVTLGTSKK